MPQVKNIYLRLKVGAQWVEWLTDVKIFASVHFWTNCMLSRVTTKKHRNHSKWDGGLQFEQEKIVVSGEQYRNGKEVIRDLLNTAESYNVVADK